MARDRQRRPAVTPQTGCTKKKCKRTWQEHYTKAGTMLKKLEKEGGHAPGGSLPSGLFRRNGAPFRLGARA